MERSRSDKVDELEITGGTYIVADKRGMTEKMIYMQHHI
jgi:DNA gyrase inhibitor GyrI